MAKQTVTASAGSKKMTKSQVVAAISEKSGLSKKDVAGVFGAMSELIQSELGKKGPGEFVVPDLLKLKLRAVPAKPKHKGINPFTKQEMTFPAKPASKKIRALPLKKLKDMV